MFGARLKEEKERSPSRNISANQQSRGWRANGHRRSSVKTGTPPWLTPARFALVHQVVVSLGKRVFVPDAGAFSALLDRPVHVGGGWRVVEGRAFVHR